jgi:ketosteroid isomerase-like protein
MKTVAVLRVLLTLIPGLAAGPAIRAGLTAGAVDAFVHDFYAAYNATGAPKLAGFYTGDATFTDPSFDLDLKGRDQIGDLLVKVLAKYESLDWEIAHQTVAGDDLTVEGTLVGKLMGKAVRVRFVSVFHFTDGKISVQRDLFDVLHFYAQLGVVPPQFRPKPAAVPAAAKGG